LKEKRYNRIILNHKNKIKIYFLGRSNKLLTSKYLRKFFKYNIRYFNGYLSEKRFYKWGHDCDILFSLNTKTNFYGKYRLSGSFGDAINLKKLLFAPHFEDPNREFSDFTVYFKNSADLIKKFVSNKKNPNFDKFYYKPNLINIVNNLKL
jgi:hypothetical protein